MSGSVEKTSDLEFAKMLSELRNGLQSCVESIDAFLNFLGQQQGFIDAKKLEKPTEKPMIPEDSFNLLKWETTKGERLGEYEVAYKSSNLPDNFNHAFNVLKANSITINNQFHEEGYGFNYWLYLEKYEDRIFRKKRQ